MSIGLVAIWAGLAVVGTGGLALIPLGFYGATVAASASGAFVLGAGFVTIGDVNLFAANELRRGGSNFLFTTTQMLGPVLFSLALFSRALIAAVTAHWACIGVAFLMGVEPDRVVPITRIVVMLLALTVLASIVSIRRSQSGGRERMAAGPRMITQWRLAVLAVGAASNFGGLLVFVAGNPTAGSWAMGIGAAMVAFEMAAIGGAAVLEGPDCPTSE